MNEAPPAPENGARSTWIGQDTVVDGKIRTSEDICIQGCLKGVLEASAAVLIPEGGQVEGDIVGRNVTIHGRVTGDVEAIEKAEIGASAVLSGGILADTVVIHAGATFEGTVRRRSQPEPKPEERAPEAGEAP